MKRTYEIHFTVKGITQKQLAGLIGTNQTEVSFIERGFMPNNYQKVVAIN